MDTNGILLIYFFIATIVAFLTAELGKTREIGYWGTFFITLLLSPLIGLLFVAFSDKKTIKTHRYKESMEHAKKEEFKGNMAIAIDKFQDALYYLNNDYQNLNPKLKNSHQTLIIYIQNKIEELKNKSSDDSEQKNKLFR